MKRAAGCITLDILRLIYDLITILEKAFDAHRKEEGGQIELKARQDIWLETLEREDLRRFKVQHQDRVYRAQVKSELDARDATTRIQLAKENAEAQEEQRRYNL